MDRRRRWFSLVAAGLLTAGACSYADLSAAGARVVTTADVPQGNCQALGTVIGEGGGGGGAWVANDDLIQHALNDMRNKAAEMGATHVQYGPPQLGGAGGTTTTATVVGTAYRCQ